MAAKELSPQTAAKRFNDFLASGKYHVNGYLRLPHGWVCCLVDEITKQAIVGLFNPETNRLEYPVNCHNVKKSKMLFLGVAMDNLKE